MFPTWSHLKEPYEKTFPNPQQHYEKALPEYQAGLETQMTWVMDWVPEPLPMANKEGTSLAYILEAAQRLNLTKTVDMPPPQTDTKQKILVFPDRGGITEQILSYAPEGRVAKNKLTVVREDPDEIDEKLLGQLMKTNWDFIIFGTGLNKPQASTVDALLECQNEFTKLYLKLAKSLVDPCDDKLIGGMAILTRGCFSNDPEFHNNGIGVISGANLFGMTNSIRMELAMPMQYVEMDWFASDKALQMVATEIFRTETLGLNTVRIHNEERYVQRQFSSKQYEKFPLDFDVPDDGIIAISGGNGAVGIIIGMYIMTKAAEAASQGRPKKFSVKFLSRSMNIPDASMKTWQDCLALSKKIGIHVEQARCDVGDRASIERFVEECTPNLTAFVHSAGVLRDSMLPNQSWEKYEEVYNPKHRAVLYLHDSLERYRNPNFDFIWLFSSDSVYGNQSATNYSGSNSFLDAFARHSRAVGKNVKSIQWGSWGEAGMAATLPPPLRVHPIVANVDGRP